MTVVELVGEQAELLRQASQALARQDAAQALALIDRADAFGVTHNAVLNRSLALRLLGDFAGSLVQVDRALSMQPYDFIALLAKGALLEKLGRPKAAVEPYRNALKIAPTRDRCPPALLAQIDYASEAVRKHAEALRDHMRQSVAEASADLDPATRERFDEGLEIYAGLKPAPKQEPILLNYPRLPAIPFYHRSLFPWLERLEAGTDMIRAELEALIASDFDRFAPYIAYPPEAPVNQWGDLNHSHDWSAVFLWKDGAKQPEVCDRCPGTTALLESLPMADQPGFAPTVTFSALQPHTHIPAHTGSANVRLLCHLPLILPGPARFRVGNDTREWKMGQAWVFDDTIEHEAWNDADALRVILIFDVWNPFLAEGEKAMITAMMQAQRRFMAD
ncbi:aspartyl/asparaginyl beta-hydroxylase domain-containing protein [Brevundimonas sp. VNH65]|uniref:aspartyl/asparaginyl beta-hydroxylase domain-containing protein n=1 Tax=Brevundimonas sp. VNH65 TaxID=3400917 RepID=UPI003C0A8B45